MKGEGGRGPARLPYLHHQRTREERVVKPVMVNWTRLLSKIGCCCCGDQMNCGHRQPTLGGLIDLPPLLL